MGKLTQPQKDSVANMILGHAIHRGDGMLEIPSATFIEACEVTREYMKDNVAVN